MSSFRGTLRRALWLALGLLGLAACQAPGPGPASVTPPPSPSVTVTATVTLPPAPSATPTALPPTLAATASPTPVPQVVTLGLAEAPGSLDPANAADDAALLLIRQMYDGLTRYQPGSTQVEPALARQWIVSSDGLTWTFTLREDAIFSDGTPLTSASVLSNFNRWQTATPPGRYAFWQLLFGGFAGQTDETGAPLSNLAEIHAAGPTTVVIRLHHPDAALPNTLAMPAFAIVNPRAWSDPFFGQPGAPSAGTGAYVLQGWSAANGLIELARNTGHWSTPPLTERLVFKPIPDDTQRLLALHTGEIDGMVRVNPADFATVRGDPALRLDFSPGSSVLYLGFNQAQPPWNVRECRLAVARTLDPARYVQDWFPGDAEVAASLVPGGMWGALDAAPTPLPDAAAAQSDWQACAAAGINRPLTTTLYVPPLARPYLPDPAGLAGAMQAALSATLSLTVQLATPDWQTQWLPDVQNGRADLFLLGWTGVNGDPDSVLCPLLCGTQAMFNQDRDGRPLPPDRQVYDWLQQAEQDPDPATRAALYAQVQTRLWAEAIAIPLVRRNTAWAFRTDITGSVSSPVETTFFTLRRTP